MVINKKTRVKDLKLAIIIIFSISLSLIILIENQKRVEIIFFTNPKCLIANRTDEVLREIESDFKDRVYIKEIKVDMYNGDPPDTEEIKILREKYQVYGIPEIIINGKEFIQKHTKDSLEMIICGNFIIKPEVCR